MFDEYLTTWKLIPDGAPILTRASALLPVRHDGAPLMLKIALAPEERSGFALMSWWNGHGAARVLRRKQAALLMERAEGAGSLANMSWGDRDDEASRVICAVAGALHAPRRAPMPRLTPLDCWFRALWPAASRHGGVFRQSASAARELLAAPRDVVALHGDIHHGNILDFGKRGWLAIDPKALRGERGFDYANLFCNPDTAIAASPGRLQRQIQVVAEASGIDHSRLLQWVLAYAGLSAAWKLDDGLDPQPNVTIAEIAAAEVA